MNTDQKTKLKAFAASSNWTMLLSHSLDKQKWEEFMAAVKARPNDIADGEVYGVIKSVTTNPCPDDIAGRMEYLCRRGKQGRMKKIIGDLVDADKGFIGALCLLIVGCIIPHVVFAISIYDVQPLTVPGIGGECVLSFKTDFVCGDKNSYYIECEDNIDYWLPHWFYFGELEEIYYLKTLASHRCETAQV